MSQIKIKTLFAIITLSMFCMCGTAHAEFIKSKIALIHAISYPDYPVILKGSDVLPLGGVPINRIGVLTVQDNQLKPITFQIDAKDKNNQYIFDKDDNELTKPFGDNDEIVFLARDASKAWWEGEPPQEKGSFITEIEFEDPVSGELRWVYVVSYSKSSEVKKTATDNIHYNQATDAIWSETYRIGFIEEIPFLVDMFHWSTPDKNCCPDIIDSMKIRHTGKLFGLFDFERTHRDYDSKIVAIKDGPVRVIRRTSNTVHVIFGYHSPEILIDFIAYQKAIFMDMHINLPFRLGLILSDLKTYTTVDQDNNPLLPASYIFSESMLEGSEINGEMDEADRNLNNSGDSWLALNSEYGSLLAGLAIEPRMPVTKQVYIADDLTIKDPPEEIEGLFGNVGYMTEGWEDVSGGIYHMLFGIYVAEKTDPKKSFEILIDAPWPM